MKKTAMTKLASDLRTYVHMTKQAQTKNVVTDGLKAINNVAGSTVRDLTTSLDRYLTDIASPPLRKAERAANSAARRLSDALTKDRFGNTIPGREGEDGSGILGTALSAAGGMFVPELKQTRGRNRSTFSPVAALRQARDEFGERNTNWMRETFNLLGGSSY